MPAIKADGKRTVKKSLDITPETDEKLKVLRQRYNLTLADLVTWAADYKIAQEEYGHMYQRTPGVT